MNKLATIETIHSFSEHTNADSLELAKVMGFQVVVRKGEFKHGDKVIFVWPDTVCQPRPWNTFLDKKGHGKPIRVKSCKLRGEFSTGVVIPLSTLGEDVSKVIVDNGVEVALQLGVDKYVKDDGSVSNGESKGGFPVHIIPRTDEDLAQSQPSMIDLFRGKSCYLSTKVDGQSFTFISYDGEQNVCSRNNDLAESESLFWRTARKYDLPDKFRNLNIAIQGEQAGPKIQENKLGLTEHELFVFNVKDLNTGEFYGLYSLKQFCKKYGLKMVPLWMVFDFTEDMTFDDIQAIADAHKYDNGSPAEGLVLRPVIAEPCAKLGGRPLSLKFVNRNYKD